MMGIATTIALICWASMFLWSRIDPIGFMLDSKISTVLGAAFWLSVGADVIGLALWLWKVAP